MGTKYYITRTAVALTAVLFFSLLGSGCATKRDIQDIQQRLSGVETQSRRTQTLVTRMDSIIAAGAESNAQLRNDVRVSVDQLGQQISQLLENYNELLQLIEKINRQPQIIRRPPENSPGAQTDTSTEIPSIGKPPVQTPAFDCIRAYDDAFILARKTEYRKAIEGFRQFLDKCGEKADNADNAHYWIAECYYSTEQYMKAISELELLLKNYSQSAKVASALYKLARSHQELGHEKDARKLFEQIVQEHPGTLEAEQAAQRLKDLK